MVGIELCRGIAATAVVLYHVARLVEKADGNAPVLSIFQFGHAGVDLFFVISGFVILFAHYDDLGRPGRCGRYVQRRLTRIMPTYLVALFLTILLRVAWGHHFPPPLRIVRSVFLLPSYRMPILGVAWSLRYEMMFYVVFCAAILNRYAGLLLFAAWLLGIVATNAGLVPNDLPMSVFGAYNLEFFAGMGAALFTRNWKMSRPGLVTGAGVMLFAVSALAEDRGLMDGTAPVARLAYGLPALLIVLGTAKWENGQARLGGVLRALGKASYSVYLFQFVWIGVAWKAWLACKLDQTLPPGAAFLALALSGVVGGVVTSQWVEYPLMSRIRNELKTGHWGKRPAIAAGEPLPVDEPGSS